LPETTEPHHLVRLGQIVGQLPLGMAIVTDEPSLDKESVAELGIGNEFVTRRGCFLTIE